MCLIVPARFAYAGRRRPQKVRLLMLTRPAHLQFILPELMPIGYLRKFFKMLRLPQLLPQLCWVSCVSMHFLQRRILFEWIDLRRRLSESIVGRYCKPTVRLLLPCNTLYTPECQPMRLSLCPHSTKAF